MDQRGELGDFLFSRRARLVPEAAGLRSHNDRRRVSGLRREELAHLAGVSPSYYARLEQGHSSNASVEVLDALARALQLDEHEHEHLRDLARATRARVPSRRPLTEHASPAMHDLLRVLVDVPAAVTGRRGDVLAWNALWHALFAGHLDPSSPERPADRPNSARLVFLDVHARELYADWPAKARAVVEHLRLTAGRHPEDLLLAALVGELTTQSTEFAELWADQGVKACAFATYELRHALVGELAVTQRTLRSVEADDQALVVITAEQGSASEAALRLLRQASAPASSARSQDARAAG